MSRAAVLADAGRFGWIPRLEGVFPEALLHLLVVGGRPRVCRGEQEDSKRGAGHKPPSSSMKSVELRRACSGFARCLTRGALLTSRHLACGGGRLGDAPAAARSAAPYDAPCL